MADRTFTEGEAYALVADAETRATAEAQERITALEAENAQLKTEKDALEVRAVAAEDAKTTAEAALETFKTEVETTKAAEAKRAERTAKVAEVAPKLELTEERANRIVAMTDEGFDAYVEDIRTAAAASSAPAPVDSKTGVPRTSAAFTGGKPDVTAGGAGGKDEAPTLGGLFGARAKASAHN